MAKDQTDKDTPDMLEQPRPKRGRPPKHKRAMTDAERKRFQRERQSQAIFEKPTEQWTDAECLKVLSETKWAHGSAMDKAAWQQLGKLRGFAER
jgi:hypothetical protein